MYKLFLAASLIALAVISCTNKNMNTNTSDTTTLPEKGETTSNSMYLLVGTYTTGESEGIYVYKFDTLSGGSEYVSMAKVTNPSYLALSNDQKFVYAVTETSDQKASANAFAFDKAEGKLTLLNSQPTGGADPCYITVDHSGKHVITANYTGGSITHFTTKEDGSLNAANSVISFSGKGADKERQTKPHLHNVVFTPDNKYLLAVDLGTDKIHKLDINESGNGDYLKLGNPAGYKVADGSGPRHIDFHPNGKYAYLINELSGAVIAFDYTDGNLKEIQSVQADTLSAKGSADIHVSPDGKFVYASNRLKGDGIAIFGIDQTNGKLTKIGYKETGTHPRNFAITPNGKYMLVACRDANAIQVFEINKQTGLLTNIQKDIKLSMPVCLKFASLK